MPKIPQMSLENPFLYKFSQFFSNFFQIELWIWISYYLLLNLCRAVFLDRDGTLIEEREYLSDPAGVVPLPKTAEGLKSLQAAGFKLFVVSNQSGVGRGYFTLDDVERVNARITSLFAEQGVRFEKIYVAPEAPDQS